MGRLALIDERPDMKDLLAALAAQGMSQTAIAEEMGVSDRGTVANWLKRDDVQAKVSKAIQDRANRILKHTDTRIEKLLESGKEIPTETLLRIRQTFAGEKVQLNVKGSQADALSELMQKLHEDPEAAARIAQQGDDPD